MHPPSPAMRNLARRVLAVRQTASDPPVHETAVGIEQLRIALTRLVGAEGFASLLRRALTLASAEVPSLQSVKVSPDGRLEGLEHRAAGTGTAAAQAGGEAVVAVVAHLLELLVTFIGEPLTLKLVQAAWPETSPGR